MVKIKLFANLREGVYSISEVPKDRWDPAVFYHPDPTMPDRTYSRIGGFLSDFSPPLRLWRIPPSVAASLDATQILALEVTHQALGDAGLLERELPRSRCAVIFGNSMGGDLRDHNMVRLAFALFAHALEGSEAARRWSAGERRALLCELEERVLAGHAPISEDSMAGELSNKLGLEVDLRILDGTSLEVRGRVIEEGVRVYSGNDELRVGLGSGPTSWPGGWPRPTASRGRASRWTRPAPLPWPPCPRRCAASGPGNAIWPSPAAWTATWAPRPM